ncbi:MAG: single-stranded DNA-binding protein [Clostridia bacterium]|nr:single-stranded DNA-binding protein [Clostridia bacterium]
MSLNLNKIILAGRLVADPALKNTNNGTAVVTFRMAVNRRFPSQNGQTEADFFRLTAFGKTAEFITRYFTKGMAICVCGRMENRSWTDQSGQKRTVDEIIVDEANFVENKGDSVGPAAAASPSPAYSAPAAPKYEQISTDDDLPF